METKITWIPFSEEEQQKIKYGQLWGENSSLKDPIISIPYNVLMPKYFEMISEKISKFDVRPDDIWIITYPKCGTTWTQEIVWHILNDVNKELGKTSLYSRSPFLEREGLQCPNPSSKKIISDGTTHQHIIRRVMSFEESVDTTASLPSPRIIKSHLPFELLPQHILDKAKVIYVCRNPKDVCVSFFHHHTDVFDNVYQFKGTFNDFAALFMQGKLENGSYIDHLKGAWKHRNHPNMKFLWYEDMKKNTVKEVSDIATFVNHPLSEDKVVDLVEHLQFSNMKERASNQSSQIGGKEDNRSKFFRKGAVGDWKNYFKEENLKIWDSWIEKSLEGSDIKFSFE